MLVSDESWSLDKIRDKIIDFKNDPNFQKLKSFYYSKSFPEIMGISRRELSHSSFWAWLLNNSESHHLGNFTIRKFFDTILKCSKDYQKEKYKSLYNIFVTDNYSIQTLNVSTEYVINNVGRIDIYIELTILSDNKQLDIILVIENKVGSKENNDQTNSYLNYFNNNKTFSEKNIIYIYLTPISTLKLMELGEPECNCKEFIQVNYQSLVDYLIEPILKQDLSTKTRFILSEYLQSLSQPSIEEDSITQLKQGMIMALGNEERKLLSDFWDKNKDLIQATLYAISSDPNQDEDTRESAQNALDALSLGKDRSTYNIYYEGKLFVRSIKKSDIGYQTIKLLEQENLITEKIFLILRQDKSCSFQLLKKTDEMTETEIKYRKYKAGGEPEFIYDSDNYYVARNWGISNIKKFIDKFEKLFPLIKYEQNQ